MVLMKEKHSEFVALNLNQRVAVVQEETTGGVAAVAGPALPAVAVLREETTGKVAAVNLGDAVEAALVELGTTFEAEQTTGRVHFHVFRDGQAVATMGVPRGFTIGYMVYDGEQDQG